MPLGFCVSIDRQRWHLDGTCERLAASMRMCCQETGSGAACGAPRSRFLLCMFRPYVLEGGGGHSHGYALAMHSVIRVWGRVTRPTGAGPVAWRRGGRATRARASAGRAARACLLNLSSNDKSRPQTTLNRGWLP